MTLDTEEKQSLRSALDKNRRHADETPSPQIGDDHPIIGAVEAAIEELLAEGRRRFKAHDIADRTEFSSSNVGRALAKLAERDRVEAVSSATPRTWQATGEWP